MPDRKKTIHSGFVNLLCKTNNYKIVRDFLKENNISIGKIRIISISEFIHNREYFKNKMGLCRSGISNKLYFITTAYKGLELKKEKFHSSYEERKRPRIISNATFGTNGKKWFVQFIYSFANFHYEPGWDYTISQEDNEYLPDFFDRVIETIDNLLIDTDNCDNRKEKMESTVTFPSTKCRNINY